MKKPKPQTYEAEVAGHKVRVTVPDDTREDDLFDAIRENLSPQAVAAIVAYLQPAKTKNKAVNHELNWFAEALTELVGGLEMQGRLAEEVGL